MSFLNTFGAFSALFGVVFDHLKVCTKACVFLDSGNGGIFQDRRRFLSDCNSATPPLRPQEVFISCDGFQEGLRHDNKTVTVRNEKNGDSFIP